MSPRSGELPIADDPDQARLQQLGYKQELKRGLSLLSNFAFSFSMISVLAGVATTYNTGLRYGGPASMTLGWLVVAAFNGCVALSMAEICSAYPTSGGLYYWSAKLAGKDWAPLASWLTGWFNIVGQWAATASVDFSLAQFVQVIVLLSTGGANGGGYLASKYVVLAIYGAILVLHGLINSLSIRWLSWFGNLGAFWNLAGVIVFTILIPAVAKDRASIDFVFTHSYSDNGVAIHSKVYTLAIGLLTSQFALLGYDTSAHMSEETKNADWSGPMGIVAPTEPSRPQPLQPKPRPTPETQGLASFDAIPAAIASASTTTRSPVLACVRAISPLAAVMAGGGARGSDRAGAGTGTGAARSPTTTTAIQSTIQSIKEVVGGHSDADILDTLRESNMDPNETAQKLLNQDPFHEVKRKRDKKKESAGQKNFADSIAQGEQSSQWMKPHTQRIEIDQRKAPNQGQMSGPSREFRVVRDNRFQHGVVENRPELGHKGSPNLQTSERSAAVVQSGRNRSSATTSDGQISHQNVKHNPHSDPLHGKRDAQGTTQKHANPYPKNSQNEHYFPGSGPAHVPANARTAGGTVGPARRQVGVINSTRQPAVHSGSQMHTPSGSSHANFQRGSFTSVGASGRHSSFMSRNIQQNQRSDTMFRGRPAGRSFGNQNINRYHQGPTNQKAVQPIKEWKPKSTKKSPTTDADNSIDDAISPSASNTENANAPDENGLSDKLSQANLHEGEHVIIPEHLRVPEYEQTKLKFGSFTSGFDSEQVPASTSADSEQPEHVQDPVQQVSEDDSLGAGLDDMDEQARSSQHLSTSAEISLPPSEDSDRMSGQVENDDGLGLVQSDTPIGAADGESAQITSTLTAFSTYGHEDPSMHSNNEAQLYGLVEPNVHPQVLASSSQQGYPSENPEADNAVQVFRMPESNVHSQVLPSTSEALNPQIVSNSPVLISSQQQHMSQQQAATQMYPPMHVQHFPNFMPYRQIYSPVYQMPMANYSPNVPYPSNGNSYLQMPGGGSHLTAGGMKYGVSQYKPVPGGNPSGYGNYTHPAGFAIGSPGVIGAAVGVDDVNRMKYKDNNIYASTPQVETSDIWIQTAREIPTLQVPPYYNISGQATPGAFVPNPANASFNATAQSSHAQFPGLYHPQQPPSIVSPHPMVHQQVPSAIGPNLGVGVAAPGPQVGGYQQPQLGHMNWRPSF